MSGLTAYSSLYEIGKPAKGETIFISAAAGAVGQLVGQFAKREGLRVIGSVGNDEKLDLIKTEFGFDGGFNYKRWNWLWELTDLCDNGVDIYYDNAGGEMLETALELMNKDGRVVVCRMVSQYNTVPEKRYGVRNLFRLVTKSLTMRGFLVGDRDFGPKWREERDKNFSKWVKGGDVRVVMSEMVGMEMGGMEMGAEALSGMLEGRSLGKAVLRVWAEEGEKVDGKYRRIAA